MTQWSEDGPDVNPGFIYGDFVAYPTVSSVRFIGNDFTDTVFAEQSIETILSGFGGDDVLSGTCVYGGDGNDQVFGKFAFGSAGNDEIIGGFGND